MFLEPYWAVFAFTRWSLATPGCAPIATALAEAILRGRNMRVLRCLARLADQRLKFRNPRCQPLDHLILRKQQIVLLGLGQNMKQRGCYP